MSADDLLAGPVDQIDVAHLAAEHRAACAEIHRLRSEVAALRAGILAVAAEIDAAHYPMRYDDKLVTDDNAVGCGTCYPHDSGWPCGSRRDGDDLRALAEPSGGR